MKEMDAYKANQELKALLKHVNKTYGFFCLTTNKDNLIMWSHYAANHKGIVVGFDAHHPFFRGSHDFYPVEYLPERISLSSNDGYSRLVGKHFSPELNYKDLHTRLFLRKHTDWAGEQEWRMIRRLEECDYHEPDSLFYLFRIPREAITEVILGAQISKENKELIHRRISSSPDWAHVKILHASLSASQFGLEFLTSEVPFV